MILWSSWKHRNDILWKKTPNADTILCRAKQSLDAWDLAQLKRGAVQNVISQDLSPRGWFPPSQGQLKCNVDAGIFNELQKTGIGFCLRNHLGQFLSATTAWLTPSLIPRDEEAQALLHAMQWVADKGYTNVVFESDCHVVVNEVLNPSINLTEFGSIVSRCRTLLSSFPNFRVSFIRRQANIVVHIPARASIMSASLCSYYVTPPCIAVQIMNEML